MNNGQKLSLDLNLSTINDKLLTEIKWNNNQSKPFLGSLNAETRFIKNDAGKPDINVDIKPSDILINDTTWHVQPASIKYNNGNLMIDHFLLSIINNISKYMVWQQRICQIQSLSTCKMLMSIMY